MEDTELLQKAQQLGYVAANQALQDDLARKLSRDSGIDLQPWLLQNVKDYPTDRQKSAEWEVLEAKAAKGGPPKSESPVGIGLLCLALKEALSIRTVKPLSSSASSWFQSQQMPDFPLKSSVAAFHHLLEQNEVVVALNSELVVKIGYHTSTQYIATFEYIMASTPGVPAPTIHGLLETDQFTYTFMDRIAGVSLDKIWNDISESKKHAIKEQLTPIFKSLRSVPKPSVEQGSFALGTGIRHDVSTYEDTLESLWIQLRRSATSIISWSRPVGLYLKHCS